VALEAKRCYGLVILNYTVTSNHIYLLILDERVEIGLAPRSIPAGPTAGLFG
jgi:hypothetical protein